MKNITKSLLVLAILVAGYTTPLVSFAQFYYPSNYTNYSYGNLSGSCSTNISNPQVGSNVNWSAYAVGATGNYSYTWTDFEGYNSTEQYISRSYSTPGIKNMTLTIRSGDQTITRYCSVYVSGTVINNPTYNPYIPPVYTPTYTAPTYQAPTAGVQNQVLGYNSNGTTLAAVYLSDVPYTGFEDVLVPVLFMLAVLSWSMLLAYKFTKNSLV